MNLQKFKGSMRLWSEPGNEETPSSRIERGRRLCVEGSYESVCSFYTSTVGLGNSQGNTAPRRNVNIY